MVLPITVETPNNRCKHLCLGTRRHILLAVLGVSPEAKRSNASSVTMTFLLRLWLTRKHISDNDRYIDWRAFLILSANALLIDMKPLCLSEASYHSSALSESNSNASTSLYV